MVILDTNILSILEWQDSSAAKKITKKLSTLPRSEIATTIVTFEEQMQGWSSFIRSKRTMKEQVAGYARVSQQLKMYCSTIILGFDELAAVEFQRLKKLHPQIGNNDLRIAAIALIHDATMVTANLRHFSPITGLKVEDWTRENHS